MSKKKSAQKKLITELKNQLLVQAESLGVRDAYTPVVMEELKIDATGKILSEFYMERSNLLYELHIMGSQKKEILIKLERLNAYILKSEALRKRHTGSLSKLLAKGQGDKQKVKRVLQRLHPTNIKVAV